ncbi:unnamed protein product [Schistosoma curassoni]|uniref:Ovule protein n=1 Tax=Schistosoma curassoni TaxID=6186 RepID=A0A183KPY0_9TREM|nr:unnamed protein product [Schistosoma curassoni]
MTDCCQWKSRTIAGALVFIPSTIHHPVFQLKSITSLISISSSFSPIGLTSVSATFTKEEEQTLNFCKENLIENQPKSAQ